MSILRYNTQCTPFNRLASLQDEVNRLFDFSYPSRDSGLFSGWSPALDLFDEKDEFVVQVELPGLKKEDIAISLQEGVLTISGERKTESDVKSGKTFRSERYFGKFQRSVTLPSQVDSQKVGAAYKDGVLTVTLAKSEEAKPRRIEVHA